MRPALSLVAALLVGCGARGSLPGDAEPVEQGVFIRSCASSVGAEVYVAVGAAPSCDTEHLGLSILIRGPAASGLQVGETVAIDDAADSLVHAWRVVGTGATQSMLSVATGTVVFTALASGASGSYAVTFTDGSTAQGAFDVVDCSGGIECK